MTMTSGAILGTLMVFYVDEVAVSYSTGCSISITGPGTVDVSNKDSSYWVQKLKKQGYTWTASVEGVFAFDGSGVDIREVYDLFRGNTTFLLRMSTGVSGDIVFSGQAVASNFSADFPYNDCSTWTFDCEGLGRLDFIGT